MFSLNVPFNYRDVNIHTRDSQEVGLCLQLHNYSIHGHFPTYCTNIAYCLQHFDCHGIYMARLLDDSGERQCVHVFVYFVW